jgi:transposase
MARGKKGSGQAGRRERRKFTDEFKQEAVRLMYERRAAGVPVSKIARDLDVGAQLLMNWARQLRDKSEDQSIPGVVETPEQELKRLRREVLQLRQEREFAKKVAVYFAKESH